MTCSKHKKSVLDGTCVPCLANEYSTSTESFYEEAIRDIAATLNTDPSFKSILKAIKRLHYNERSAKRMIARLRHRKKNEQTRN